jgi:broad specificity phosphatase PhoE
MKRRGFLRVTTALIATAVAVYPQWVRSQTQLVPDLLQGGYVIYFRHGTKGKTAGTVAQLPTNLKQCLIPDEPLTEAGITMMKTIGTSFEKLKIPIGKVYSSPVCRCVQSAWYGFKQVEVRPELYGIIPEGTKNQAALNEKWAMILRRMLSTVPAKGTNTILVAHSSNMSALVGLSLAEGEAAVFKPDGKGGFSYVERLKAEDWSSLASTSR